MARVLLTGANGFVGAALRGRLSAQGHEVVAISSRAGAEREARDRVEMRRLDLLTASEAEVARLVGETGATHCVHAAWYTNHADYLIAPVNADWLAASQRLADGFHAGGGRRFVGLGTCLEYDQAAGGGRFSEAGTPLRPETPYARAKTALFERLAARAATQGHDFAWARVFFIYGPGDRAGRLIPDMVERLRRGEPVAPRFGGLRRDYIHVDDLAEQLSTIALGNGQGAINTGTSRATRLADIARLLGDVARRPDLIEANELLDPAQSPIIEADMDLYRSVYGNPACRPLREGLSELLGEVA